MENIGPRPATSVFDVAVVGAGPLGLAVAHRLSRRGLTVCLLEADGVGSTVRRYPEGMILLSPAENLILEERPLAGKAPGDSVNREELIEYLETFAQSLSVDLRSPCRVVRIAPCHDHHELACETPAPCTVRAKLVVVTIGSFARPHWIDVPGEDGPRVHHSHPPGADLRGKRCLVVGGRNSALTTAANLLEGGADVTLVHRRPDLDRAWAHLREPVLRAAARGEIRLLLESRVLSFGQAEAQVVSVAGGESCVCPFDAAFVMTGFDPDLDLFARSGIALDARTGAPTLDPSTHESSLAGVYVAGPASVGKQDDVRIYIHTSLPHVARIEDAIVSRLASRSERRPAVIQEIDQTLRFRDFDFKVSDRQFERGPTEPEDVRLVVVDARNRTIEHDTFVNLASYFGPDDLLLENSAGIGRSRLQGVSDRGVPIDICFLLDRSENRWECVVLGDRVDAPEEGAFELAHGAIRGRFIECTQDFDGPYWIEKNRYRGYRGLVEISASPQELRAVLDSRGSYMHPWYTNLNDLPEETLNPAGVTSATAALLAEPARRMSPEIRSALRARGVDRALIALFMSFSWRQIRPDQRLADYQMNPEEISMPEGEVEKLRGALESGKRVTSIGTSGIRVVESLPGLERGYAGLTDCFVAPGFRFRHSHGLLTNLHNPMGTHVIMAAAIAGHELVMKAYRECVELGYHFGIHGDSMLVFAPNA